MKKIKFLLVIALASIIAVSCSKDDSGPSYTNFFPGTMGSYWINYNYDVNDSTKAKTQTGMDSVVVSNIKTMDGKSATEFTTFTYNDTTKKWDLSDITYYAKEGAKLYMSSATMNNAVAGAGGQFGGIADSLTITDPWILMADENGTSWNIANKNIGTIDPGISSSYSVKFTSSKFVIDGKKGAKENVNVKGVSYTAQNYIVTSTFTSNINATVPILGAQDVGTMSLTSTITVSVVDNIGIVKQVNVTNGPNITINSTYKALLALAGLTDQNFGNTISESDLFNFYIAK